MSTQNKGFSSEVIQEYQDKMKKLGQNFVIENTEDNTDEFVNFLFLGMFEGKRVIYDIILYTLQIGRAHV